VNSNILYLCQIEVIAHTVILVNKVVDRKINIGKKEGRGGGEAQ
jgi:hypothetical protein